MKNLFSLFSKRSSKFPISFRIYDLPNFVTLVYAKYNASCLSHVSYNFDIGSSHETNSNNGIAHFLEHNIFKGTEKRDKNSISKFVEERAGSMNAYTSKKITSYYIEMPPEHHADCTEILNEMMFCSIFPEEEVVKERNVVAEEFKMRNSNENVILWDNAMESIFGENTPYGRTIIGPLENILSFTREDLLNFYEFYRTGNLTIFFCADSSTNEFDVVRRIEKLILNVPKNRIREAISKDSNEKNVFLQNCIIHEPRHFEHVRYMLTMNLSNFSANNIYDDTKLSLFTYCLSGGFCSPFFKIIRDEKGLVYSAGVISNTEYPSPLLHITGATSPEKVEEFIHLSHDVTFHPEKYLRKENLEIAKTALKAQLRKINENKNHSLSVIKDLYYLCPKEYLSIEKEHFMRNWIDKTEKVIDEVTFEDMISFPEKFENTYRGISIVGKLDRYSNSIYELLKSKYGNSTDTNRLEKMKLIIKNSSN